MKKCCSFLLAVLLLAGLLGALPTAAAGTLTASATASSVSIGNQVTVTLKYNGGNAPIGSIDAQFHYNATAFQYVSCSGATANGGAGVVSISYYPTAANAPTAVTITLIFKALAAGEGKFSVETSEFTNDNDYSSLGTPAATLSVSAINPTKSGNANLASLKPSSGTLTPAFNAKTTSYTITVPYTTTTLNLSATTAHKEAKVAVSGSNSLKVGKNTRVITVTAANGTTKKYTVVITRSANQTTATQSGSTTTTTTTRPAEELLEVAVDGVLMTVSDTQPNVTLPTGFAWGEVSLNGLMVSAAKNETTGMVLLYLTNATETASDFYVYYETAGQFELFRPLAVKGGQYTLLAMPAGQEAPAGTVAGTLTYAEGKTVSAFVYEDAALADYTVVYATSPAGLTGLYVYDRTDGSLQRYHQTPAEEEPVDNDLVDEPQAPTGILAFFTTYRTHLLVGGAACGGLALLIGAVVLLVVMLRRPRNSRCKH